MSGLNHVRLTLKSSYRVNRSVTQVFQKYVAQISQVHLNTLKTLPKKINSSTTAKLCFYLCRFIFQRLDIHLDWLYFSIRNVWYWACPTGSSQNMILVYLSCAKWVAPTVGYIHRAFSLLSAVHTLCVNIRAPVY